MSLTRHESILFLFRRHASRKLRTIVVMTYDLCYFELSVSLSYIFFVTDIVTWYNCFKQNPHFMCDRFSYFSCN